MIWYPHGITPNIEPAALTKQASAQLLDAAGIESDSPLAEGFLKGISIALGVANAREYLKNQTMPAVVKKDIRDIRRMLDTLAEKLSPLRTNGCVCDFFDGGAIQLDEYLTQIGIIEANFAVAAKRAEKSLPAKGALVDYTRRHLAEDVAGTLSAIGINPTVSRPRQNRQGKIIETKYISVLRVVIYLFDSSKITDPYPSAREGLKLFRRGYKNCPSK